MRIKLVVIALLLTAVNTSSCQDKKQTTNQTETRSEAIHILRSGLFKNYTPKKIQVADFIEHYFNLMYDSTLERRNALWDSKILTHQQDFLLKGNFEKGFFIHYQPKILGIRNLENNVFEAKLEIEQEGFTYKIMNLLISFDGLNRPYFIDCLGENLEDFTPSKTDNLTFLYSKKVQKNDSLEQKMVVFNEKMANLFNLPQKKISVIVLKDLKDYSELLGYDYMTFLTYDGQTGGIAMPQENILFSANNSPYYPHELVHLYTANFDAHYWFDEGCATYLGGSVEYPLEYHLRKIASQMDSLNFSNLPEDTKLDDDTNLKYAIGGLFCKLAMEEFGGKESVFKLLNSGKADEEFHAALKAVFGIEQTDYDSFVREKLRKYEINDKE